MKNAKKINIYLLSTLLAILFFTIAFFVFATNTDSKNYDQKINITLNLYKENSLQNIKNPSYKIDSNIFISAEDFTRLYKIPHWKEGNSHVFFYDNNFVKASENNEKICVNGHDFTIDNPPFVENNLFYIPITLFAEQFDYNVKEDIEKDTIHTYQRNTNRTKMIGSNYLIKTHLKEFDLSFYRPYNWEKIKQGTYGIWDEFSKFTITIVKESLYPYQSLDDFIENFKNDIEKNKEYEIISNKSVVNFGDKKWFLLSYHKEEENSPLTIAYDAYFYADGNDVFIFKGQYNNDDNPKYAKEQYKNMIKFAYRPSKEIDKSVEHYFEIKEFTKNILEKSSIHSNEILSKPKTLKLRFENISYDDFFISVQKDQNKIELGSKINKNGNLTELEIPIYAPFGLGKHNYTLYASTKKSDKPMLYFSLLNTKKESQARYKIPTRFVLSTSDKTTKTIDELGVQALKIDEKIDKIYDYITNNIKLSSRQSNKKPSNSDVLLENLSCDPLETNIVLATLLRNVNIPAKIYIAKKEKQNFYFVEVEKNGMSYALNPVIDILLKNSSELPEWYSFLSTGTKPLQSSLYYKEKFDNFSLLNY